MRAETLPRGLSSRTSVFDVLHGGAQTPRTTSRSPSRAVGRVVGREKTYPCRRRSRVVSVLEGVSGGCWDEERGKGAYRGAWREGSYSRYSSQRKTHG